MGIYYKCKANSRGRGASMLKRIFNLFKEEEPIYELPRELENVDDDELEEYEPEDRYYFY